MSHPSNDVYLEQCREYYLELHQQFEENHNINAFHTMAVIINDMCENGFEEDAYRLEEEAPIPSHIMADHGLIDATDLVERL